ncbi:MAG: hypothetical protein RL341_1847, partial [Pseudomonadota bacterium]
MDGMAASAGHALSLMWAGDQRLVAIIALSLQVSLTAVVIAGVLGLILGSWIAVTKFP